MALAKLLIEDHDVIMLDEPTNHLDVEGVAWLARHLKTRWRANQGAFLVVTHDRWFLDEVCNKTWEVARRHHGPVRGRLRGLRPGTRGARPDGLGDRIASASNS